MLLSLELNLFVSFVPISRVPMKSSYIFDSIFLHDFVHGFINK